MRKLWTCLVVVVLAVALVGCAGFGPAMQGAATGAAAAAPGVVEKFLAVDLDGDGRPEFIRNAATGMLYPVLDGPNPEEIAKKTSEAIGKLLREGLEGAGKVATGNPVGGGLDIAGAISAAVLAGWYGWRQRKGRKEAELEAENKTAALGVVVTAVEEVRKTPEGKRAWSDAADAALAKSPLDKGTYTAQVAEVKAGA